MITCQILFLFFCHNLLMRTTFVSLTFKAQTLDMHYASKKNWLLEFNLAWVWGSWTSKLHLLMNLNTHACKYTHIHTYIYMCVCACIILKCHIEDFPAPCTREISGNSDTKHWHSKNGCLSRNDARKYTHIHIYNPEMSHWGFPCSMHKEK
jgi:hypothetical protein